MTEGKKPPSPDTIFDPELTKISLAYLEESRRFYLDIHLRAFGKKTVRQSDGKEGPK